MQFKPIMESTSAANHHGSTSNNFTGRPLGSVRVEARVIIQLGELAVSSLVDMRTLGVVSGVGSQGYEILSLPFVESFRVIGSSIMIKK
ncbi:uncharacterized protein G2W53_006195 [Senna tora]|uniref:Uncharacterized protein n=1 Tax=Senna tora TaxID=362788 RepID=A0A834X380_9FABA|nr:uncharacterized protein G2W53_006195 [Senna tora]